jgi:pSer/pThr/pTyr-binding forkhead associated (FHA) protein
LISIGREKDADIFLDDVTVSRQHAILERSESIYTVSDTGSLNGTYLNGKSVLSEELTDGDVLQIGRFKLVFFHGMA